MGIKHICCRCSYFMLLSALANVSIANQFCFATADTFYEQVYCELEVRGQVKNLPPFEQFKKNREVVQASLLKASAERNGIQLPAPKKDVQRAVTTAASAERFAGSALAPVPVSPAQPKTTSGCSLHSHVIDCGDAHYHLLTNKTNNHLIAGVLGDGNKMALPVYGAGQSIDTYLTLAYQHYIEKMCAIGLAGVTMTYGKFAFFYQDLQEKGVSFVQRFETMYSFLKKDKASLWVSEKIPESLPLTIADCDSLSRQYFVCAAKGQNYIFELR